ncbi:MAG: LytR family transcriptional regulator [Bacillota bacterium]|jgi:LCP family protein required for cell wall assembly
MKKTKTRKVLSYILFPLSLVLATTCGYTSCVLWDTFSSTQTKNNLDDDEVDTSKPFTVLLAGHDARGGKELFSRPDVLMLLSFNPEKKELQITHIPRDLRVKIPDLNTPPTKINHTCAYAKEKNIDPSRALCRTVQSVLKVPVHYYCNLNMKAFIKGIDAIGGIDVNIPAINPRNKKAGFSQKMLNGKVAHFTPGPCHLDGQKALACLRMRKDDPNSDSGRNVRQRIILLEALKKISSFYTLAHLSSISEILKENVEHNIPATKVLSLKKAYDKCCNNVKAVRIPTSPKRIDNLLQEIADPVQLKIISNSLRKHLGLLVEERQANMPLKPTKKITATLPKKLQTKKLSKQRAIHG